MYPYPRMAERRWVNHIMREEVDGLAPLLERFPMYWHNPAGAWHREPDKAQWVDLTTGYPCLAVRGGSGSWRSCSAQQRYSQRSSPRPCSARRWADDAGGHRGPRPGHGGRRGTGRHPTFGHSPATLDRVTVAWSPAYRVGSTATARGTSATRPGGAVALGWRTQGRARPTLGAATG